MRLIKPKWVNHGGKPIFSVDIHPDGQKFATGGQGEDSGKVVIWDLRPVRREEDEKNESIPKLLCQMDNHLACVNCVRWSNSGKLLASGGDDKLVMIWRPVTFIGPSPSPSTMFGSGGNVANVEQWRCASVLRYHSGDVMDVAWSPHDAWLATGSIDNSVVIWNACKFPEVIATLRGHSGLVKGVTWDPVGKYVASQADDKSLKVWSTLDWRLEASITEPFRECGGTTQVLRLGWSPDGHYIVSAHAMNNSGPTAQIVEREGWRSSMDFVGHRKAVTVVRFNPKIFQWKLHNGGADKPGFPYSCCAIGSKDRSLSVWLTCLKRPLVVVHDLFDKSIMDISWNVSGFEMLVCSMDGSVAFAEFSLEELGNPLSQEEKNAIHQKTYGKSLSISSEATIGSTVIESPAMLHLQQQQWGAEERPAILREGPTAEERLEGTGEMGTPGEPMVSVMPYRTVLNGESLEQIRKNLLKNQKETRTPDGRRRITPLCIAQLDISEYQSSAFSSVPLASSVSQFALFSSNPPSPVPDGDAEGSNPIVTQQEPDKHSPEREALPSPIPMSPSKLEPMRALDSRFTERPKVPASPSPVTPTTTTQQQSSVTNVTVNAGPAAVAEKSTRETATPLVEGVSTVTPSGVGGRVESAAASLVVSVRPQRESSSDSDDRAAVGVKGHVPPPVPRKKTEGEDGSALKKKGRPRKDPKIVATGLVIQASTHVEKDPSRLSATTTPTLKLPVIVAQKSFSLQVSSEPGLSLEVENETGGVGNLKLHRLVCRREGAGSWDTHLTSRVLAAAASSEAVAVACEDRTLIAFSSCGRRLLPPLILPALPSSLQLNQHFVLLLTILGTLHVWDLRSNRAVIDGQSLSPIVSGSEVSVTRIVVTNQGMPLVTLNSGRSYSYSTSLAAWMQVCDPQNPLTLVSDLQSNLPTQHALHCSGPLASLQSQGGSSGRQASRLASLGPKLRGAATLIHLEGQVAAALALHSPSEYRFWLLSYARYLTHEGLESRLRELCTELLGPVPVSSSSQWDPYVLGLSRRGLLREVLPLLGTNLKLQRLFSELQEQLEAAATD